MHSKSVFAVGPQSSRMTCIQSKGARDHPDSDQSNGGAETSDALQAKCLWSEGGHVVQPRPVAAMQAQPI